MMVNVNFYFLKNNMKDNYQICISSPPDREKLVAEILFDHIQWAEINQESDILQIQIYPRPDEKPWRINLLTLISVLNEAKFKLVGNFEITNLNKSFEYKLTSSFFQKQTCCNINYDGKIIAKIYYISNELIAEMHIFHKLGWLKIPLYEFKAALEEAKLHILNHKQ